LPNGKRNFRQINLRHCQLCLSFVNSPKLKMTGKEELGKQQNDLLDDDEEN
jgi:hypothetical protein